MPEAPAPDPIATRSGRAFWAFGWYLRWYFYRKFHAVRISHAGRPHGFAGRPLIIYGNHPSWWDPALYILLCTVLFPGRRGYGPMDAKALGNPDVGLVTMSEVADQIGAICDRTAIPLIVDADTGFGNALNVQRTVRVFERMGVFGIALDTPRGAARFLSTSLRILSDPASILWITAEGEFADVRRRPLQLRPGIAHLARRVPGAVILPLAVEYPFWNESRPEALVRFGDPIESGPQRTVAGWTGHLEAELTRTMDGLAAEAVQRDPRRFQTLLRGGGGVGGIYDLYRRSRAFAAGRRFDPRHESRE